MEKHATPSARPLPSPLPASLLEAIARRFRILAEPMRLRILDQLRSGPATVGELQHQLDATQQNVSRHLQLLYDASIVARVKRGTAVEYSIADESVFGLCEMVCGGIYAQLQDTHDSLHGSAS